MIPEYVPILKALGSESEALEHSYHAAADRMLPLFEVPKVPSLPPKYVREAVAPSTAWLDKIVERIVGAMSGRPAMIDAHQWSPNNAVIENGSHVISYAFDRLRDLGVPVLPVIGYDRGEDRAYLDALRNCIAGQPGPHMLRLDSFAMEDSREPGLVRATIDEMLHHLRVDTHECGILLDFEDMFRTQQQEALDRARSVLDQLAPAGFQYFVVAGCSLPGSINLAVSKPDSSALLPRKEMILWQTLRMHYPELELVYGDYAVRGPRTNDTVRNPHANGKIRYTTDNAFFIARGYSRMMGAKGAQMYELARRVQKSSHYMGPTFSWGDERIAACANEEFKGSLGDWIKIDTNHHFAYALREVREFTRRTESTPERIA